MSDTLQRFGTHLVRAQHALFSILCLASFAILLYFIITYSYSTNPPVYLVVWNNDMIQTVNVIYYVTGMIIRTWIIIGILFLVVIDFEIADVEIYNHPIHAQPNATWMSTFYPEQSIPQLYILILCIFRISIYSVVYTLLINDNVDITGLVWKIAWILPVILSLFLFISQYSLFVRLHRPPAPKPLSISSSDTFYLGWSLLALVMFILFLFMTVYPLRDASSAMTILFEIELGILTVAHVCSIYTLYLLDFSILSLPHATIFYLGTQLIEYTSCFVLMNACILLWWNAHIS